jgi:hypothetical protein
MFCIKPKPNHKACWIIGLVNNKMADTTKFTTMEYRHNFKLSQISKENYFRCDIRKLSPVKSLNCIVKKVEKLMAHIHNINEVTFSIKYRQPLQIMKMEVWE